MLSVFASLFLSVFSFSFFVASIFFLITSASASRTDSSAGDELWPRLGPPNVGLVLDATQNYVAKSRFLSGKQGNFGLGHNLWKYFYC